MNYGGNKKPELLTCLHEESAVAMAHGYAKAAGKPMGVFLHGTVGLQHAAMDIYNAWVDRVPVIMIAGNGSDANKRRPGTEWNHSVQDAAAMVRDFVKWDDAPASLQHFAESTVRAYKIAMTPPMEPVLVMADIDLQEEGIHDTTLKIPKLSHSIPPMGDSAALAEAAKWLVDAKFPVIVADRMARSQAGVDALVKLAEALGAAVVDMGGRMNFPNQHPLCHSDRRRALVREADVVLLLEVADPWGQFNSFSDPQKIQHFVAAKGVKIVNLSMQDVFIRSNYQDFQRYMPVDLSINGDAQASLPALTEQVLKLMTPERQRVAAERAASHGEQARKSRAARRESAARGWETSPVTTARLAMETYDVIRNEPWALVDSAADGDAQQPRLLPGSAAPAAHGGAAPPSPRHGADRQRDRQPGHSLRTTGAGARRLGRGADCRPQAAQARLAARAGGGEKRQARAAGRGLPAALNLALNLVRLSAGLECPSPPGLRRPRRGSGGSTAVALR